MTQTAVEPKAEPKGPNPIDNLAGWLDEKTKPREVAQATEPVSVTAPEPEAAKPADWREVVLPDDVEHEFLRGKKLPDVVKSWKSSQDALKEAQRIAGELKREAEQLRREREADIAARRVAAEQRAASEPTVDPYAELEEKFFEDPRYVMARIKELAVEEAKAASARELERIRDEDRNSYRAQDLLARAEAAHAAAPKALGVDEETYAAREPAILTYLTDPGGPWANRGGPTELQNYVEVHNLLWPSAQPTVAAPPPVAVVAAPPKPADPPGAKRAATPAVQPAPAAAISAEQRHAWETLARAADIDPERYIKRMTRER